METLKILSSKKTAEFFNNQPSLVFCEQNEFARFGAGTDRQYGGTGGMESCSAAFLWNKDTQESYVFHTHYGTNWKETKKLFETLCAEGNWEITPASGKAFGAWQKLEDIASEIERESGGRVTQKPTAHMNLDKKGYHALSFEEQMLVPHNSYMQNSTTGEVVGLHEETLHVYWNRDDYSHIFNDSRMNSFTNAFQYITRQGTVPVCSFDGYQHTGAPPQLESTPEMREIWKKCEDIVVSAILTHCKEGLSTLSLAKTSEERIAAIELLKGGRDPREHPAYNEVRAKFSDPEHGIIDPERFKVSNEGKIRIYAGQIWRGFFINFEEYADKALVQSQQRQSIPPEMQTALTQFHANTDQVEFRPQKQKVTASNVPNL